MKTMVVLSTLLALGYGYTQAQVSESAIRHHLKVLANDSLLGRGTGTPGEKMAAAYIEQEFEKIGMLPKGENRTYFQSFPFKAGAHGTGREGTARNILGFIDNQADNTIVIGAHYDHLGLGLDGSSLDANPQNKIHNGADDNASGVAGVIELARYFKNNRAGQKNNFLFICFSGEELGLYGSKYFTDHPTVDLSKIDFMINLDMIGRLDPVSRSVAVSGTGTAAGWEKELKNAAENSTLVIKTDSSGVGPSDHTSFYLKSIPVLHFFTGAHSDYHKPSDDSEKINYAGEVAVLNFIIRLVNTVEDQPKFAFLATKNKSMGQPRSFNVTLGIMPSYTANVSGLQIDGVSAGKPAEKAGMQTGDIIVQMDALPIHDIESYMGALGKFKKGQTIPVKVKRGDKTIELEVTF
jgi:hypothetical protein